MNIGLLNTSCSKLHYQTEIIIHLYHLIDLLYLYLFWSSYHPGMSNAGFQSINQSVNQSIGTTKHMPRLFDQRQINANSENGHHLIAQNVSYCSRKYTTLLHPVLSCIVVVNAKCQPSGVLVSASRCMDLTYEHVRNFLTVFVSCQIPSSDQIPSSH